jgi:hypothetical protein
MLFMFKKKNNINISRPHHNWLWGNVYVVYVLKTHPHTLCSLTKVNKQTLTFFSKKMSVGIIFAKIT